MDSRDNLVKRGGNVRQFNQPKRGATECRRESLDTVTYI